MSKILVAIDGSEYSQKALLKAKDIALAMKSDVTLLNVINIRLYYDFDRSKYLEKENEQLLRETSAKLLEEAKKEFEDFHVNVETVSKIGDPVSEIVGLAEEGKFDLIVMGSRGLGRFSRTLLGSVSDKVVHHVNTSVLIVK